MHRCEDYESILNDFYKIDIMSEKIEDIEEMRFNMIEYGVPEEMVKPILQKFKSKEDFWNCTRDKVSRFFTPNSIFEEHPELVDEEEYEAEGLAIIEELFQDFLDEFEFPTERAQLLEWLSSNGVPVGLARELVRKFRNKRRLGLVHMEEVRRFVTANHLGCSELVVKVTLNLLVEKKHQLLDPNDRDRLRSKQSLCTQLENQLSTLEHLLSRDLQTNPLSDVDWSVCLTVELSMSDLGARIDIADPKKQLEEQKRIVQGDLEVARLIDLSWPCFLSKFRGSRLGSIFRIDKNLLFSVNNLENLADNLVFQSQKAKNRLARSGVIADFDSLDAVREYQKSVRKHGFFVPEELSQWPGSGLRAREQVAGAGEGPAETFPIESSQVVRAHFVKSYQQEMKLELSQLKLKPEIFSELQQLSEAKDEHFSDRLRDLEAKWGSVFNGGNYHLGGILMVVGSLPEESTWTRHELAQLVDLKIRAQVKNSMLPSDSFRVQIDSPAHAKPSQKLSARQGLLDRVRLDFHCLTSDHSFDSIESFQNQMEGSNTKWGVIGQDSRLTHWADLLTLPANATHFRQLGMTGAQLLRLKSRIWDDFGQRIHLQLQSNVADGLGLYSSSELSSAEERIKSSFNKRFLREIESLEHLHIEDDQDVLEELLVSIGQFQNECTDPLSAEVWRQIKAQDQDFIGYMRTFLLKIEEFVRNESGFPEAEQLIGQARRRKIAHFIELFMCIWDREPEGSEHNANDPLVRAHRFLVATHAGLAGSLRAASTRPLSEDFVKRVQSVKWETLSEFFRDLSEEHLGNGDSESSSCLRIRLNYLVSEMCDNQDRNFDGNLYAFWLCFYKCFDVSVEKLFLFSCPKKETIQEFCIFYQKNKKILCHIFSEKSSTFENMFQNWLGDNLEPAKRRQFVVFLQRSGFHSFSRDFLESHVYRDEIDHVNFSLTNPALKSDLEKCVDLLRSLRKPSQPDLFSDSESLSDQSASSSDPLHHLRSIASAICDGKQVISYQEAMRVKSRPFRQKMEKRCNNWELILNQILIKNNPYCIEFDAEEISPADYVTAILVLADDNLKRLLVTNLYRSHSPIPLMLPQNVCFWSPLAALSLPFRRGPGQSSKLNPFAHPSVKVLFFQTGPLNHSAQDLANHLYFSRRPLFSDACSQETFLSKTVSAGFTTNINSSGISALGELSLVLVDNAFFESVSTREHFLLEISQVIFLLRKPGDSEKAACIFNFVRKHNQATPASEHKLLIEVVECISKRAQVSTPHPRHSWFLRLRVSRQYPNTFEISHFLSFHFQFGKLAHGLDSLERVSESYNDREVYFHNQAPEMKNIWTQVDSLMETITQAPRDSFKLQDTLQRLFQQNESNILEASPDRPILLCENHLRDDLRRIRLDQLRHISALDRNSPVLKFVRILESLDSDERLSFLFYLDPRLQVQSVEGLFEGAPLTHLKAIHFFRELTQIYEVLDAFGHELGGEEDPNVESLKWRLKKFPQMVAELFWNLYPVELVNGDQNAISIRWLKALFSEISHHPRSKNVKVSTVSIVGPKHSGKSTFLNSLFNLSFEVENSQKSSGSRAVMLPLDKASFEGQAAEGTAVPDLVVVVDTEGLGSMQTYTNLAAEGRSSQLSARENKMLLFNAGLSDLCVVNSIKEISLNVIGSLTMLMYSLARLDDFKIKPALNLVFQRKEFSQEGYQKLWKTSVNNLELIYRKETCDVVKRIPFKDLLRFPSKDGHQLKLIPSFESETNFGENYVRNIQDYHAYIFSREFLFDPGSQVSLSLLKKKLVHLYNCVSYESYNFDADSLMNLEQTRVQNVFKFKLKGKINQMFEERLEKLGISDVVQLQQKRQELIDGIGPLSPGLSSLAQHIQQARSVLLIGRYDDHTHPALVELANEQFDSFLHKMTLKNQTSDSVCSVSLARAVETSKSQIQDSLATAQSKIKPITSDLANCDKKNRFVENYYSVVPFFDSEFTESEKEIKKLEDTTKQNLRELINFPNKLLEVLEKIKIKSQREISLNPLVEGMGESNRGMLELMLRKLDEYNFANYPIYLAFDQDFQKRHFESIQRIRSELSIAKIVENLKHSHEAKINTQINYDILNDWCEVLMTTSTRMDLPSLSKLEQTRCLFDIPKELLSHRRNYASVYQVHLVFHSIKVFRENCRRYTEQCLEKIRLIQDFHDQKVALKAAYITKLDYRPNFRGLTVLFSVIEESVRRKAQRELNEGYLRKIKKKMKKHQQIKYCLRKIQIRKLRKLKDIRTEEEKISFVKDLIRFGSNFEPDLHLEVQKVIEKCQNADLYHDMVNRKKEQELGKIRGILSSVETMPELEAELKIYFESEKCFTIAKKYCFDELKSMKVQRVKRFFNKINNKENSFNIFENIAIDTTLEKISKYTKVTQYCLYPCAGCGAPCTLEKNHRDANHSHEYHLPLLFKGKASSSLT